jgi:hypothetical protein
MSVVVDDELQNVLSLGRAILIHLIEAGGSIEECHRTADIRQKTATCCLIPLNTAFMMIS